MEHLQVFCASALCMPMPLYAYTLYVYAFACSAFKEGLWLLKIGKFYTSFWMLLSMTIRFSSSLKRWKYSEYPPTRTTRFLCRSGFW